MESSSLAPTPAVPDVPRVLVLYHANCTDGLVAAWAARRAFGHSAEYLPVRYGDPPPVDAARGRDVLLVDFSYPRAELFALASAASSLQVLDHHKSAAAELEGLAFCTFDLERSGARLAWDHLHPGVEVPWIVLWSEDRDLWRWRLPDSRAVNAWLGASMRTLDDVDRVVMEGFDHARIAGGACLVAMERYLDAAVADAQLAHIAGYVVPVVNATRRHVSELLERLAIGQSFAAAWHVRGDGSVQYSLRAADEEGAVDVSTVAACFGGGGNKRAAGFEVPSLADIVHRAVGR